MYEYPTAWKRWTVEIIEDIYKWDTEQEKNLFAYQIIWFPTKNSLNHSPSENIKTWTSTAYSLKLNLKSECVIKQPDSSDQNENTSTDDFRLVNYIQKECMHVPNKFQKKIVNVFCFSLANGI